MLPKPQKHLAGLVHKRKEELFLSGLSPDQLEQVAAMRDPGSALYPEAILLVRGVSVPVQEGAGGAAKPAQSGPSLGLDMWAPFYLIGGVVQRGSDLMTVTCGDQVSRGQGSAEACCSAECCCYCGVVSGFICGVEWVYLGATAHGDITLSGFQPLSMVVDVKNINIKGINVVARKAAKETENERLYKAPCTQVGWISAHL